MKFSHIRVVLLIGVFLLLIEGALEFRAVRRGWETLLWGGPAHQNNIMNPHQNEQTTRFGPTAHFNFRSPVISGEKSSDTVRIWFASTSMGFAPRYRAENIFPNLAQKYLLEYGRQIEVINASRIAWVISQNIRELTEESGKWSPDLVILYQLSNDVNRISKLIEGGQYRFIDNALDKNQNNKKKEWARRLTEETTLFAHLRQRVTSKIARCKILMDDIPPEGWKEMEYLIRKFIATCGATGAVPILCTFATSHTRADLPWPAELKDWLFRWNMSLSVTGWVNTVGKYNNLLRGIAEEQDLILIDVAREVSGKKQLFDDFVHFSKSGHQAVALKIASDLSKLDIIGKE